VVVLLAASAYQLLIAAGAVSIGRVSGEGAAYDAPAVVAALAATVLGLVLAAVRLGRPRRDAAPASVALAAAAFTTCRLYAYDPYYAPLLRRMSDGGLVPPGWVFFLVGLAVTAGVLVRLEARASAVVAAATLLLCFLTIPVESAGH
jgi:hypothetical protein